MRPDISHHALVYRILSLFIAAAATACTVQTARPPGPVLTPMLENPSPAPSATSAVLPASPTPTSSPLPSLPPAQVPPAGQAPAGFYRLELTLATTSDWTSLDFNDPQAVLAERLVATSGSPKIARLTPGEIYLSQPQTAAKAGNSASLTAELAIAAPLTADRLSLTLKRGGIPATTLTVSAQIRGASVSLLRLVHAQRIPGDPGSNTMPVSLDLAPLAGAAPAPANPAYPAVPKMVWAFYYPWYHTSDWSSPELKDHPLVPYQSFDPQAIARQIGQAKSAGIDGFISSWWGPGSYTDQNLKPLLAAAQLQQFKVMLYFETLQSGGPLPGDEITRWLAYAIPAVRDAPAYMKIGGKPVIAFYNSGLVPLAEWKDIFARLHAQGLDSYNLAMGLDAASLDVFDGMHTYAVISYPDLAGAYSQASRAAHYYPLLAPGSTPKLWAATIQSGYDERLIPGRRGLVQARDNGDYYRSTFQAALGSRPDWILITSWNEWWENTYIEPGKLYGDLYLKLTQEFASQWKNGPPAP